jgi:hypothetical protein
MKMNRAFAMIAGMASGKLIRHITPSREHPSIAAASSRLTGTVSK